MTQVPKIAHGAHARESSREGVAIVAPYRTAFKDELKQMVPPAEREWWRDEETWWVSYAFADDARDVLLAHWPEIEVWNDDGGDYVLERDGTVHEQHQLFE